MENIIKCIINGYRNGYYQILQMQLLNDDFLDNIIEYFFTVNVSIELLNNNAKRKDLLFIYPEYKANEFINNAFPIFTMNIEGLKKRIKHKSIRKGRIDIALLKKLSNSEPNLRSFAAIEFKAMDRSFSLINKDIKRIIHAMEETDELDENSIDLGFVVFAINLSSNKKILEKDKLPAIIKKKTAKIKAKFDKFIDSNKFHHDLTVFDINTYTDEDYKKSDSDEFLNQEGAIKITGSILGLILSIQRK